MTSSVGTFSKGKKSDLLINIAWNVIPPIIFLILIFIFIPFQRVFYFDSDEGYNLIKSVLMLRGYSLYSEIWSDQPPLLTYLLTGVFKIFSLDVNIGRIVILGFAVLLIWAFTQYISIISSRWHALAGLMLLCVLPNFVKLSVSIMIGLPAIALAMVALFLTVLWHRSKHSIWLWLAGAVLALSVLTKLFTGLLAPILAIGILIDEVLTNKKAGHPWYRLPAVISFCASFILVVAAGIVFLIKPNYLSLLLFTHTNAQEVDYYSKTRFTFGWYLKQLFPFCILSITGCIWIVKTKHWLGLYAIAWAFGAFIFHWLWRPVWYHHVLLFTIPSAILASMVIIDSSRYIYRSFLTHGKEGFSRGVNGFTRITWINLFLIALFIINWAWFGILLLQEINRIKESVQSPTSENQICFEILSQINSYAPQTQWFISEVPMFTVRANLPTPPALAVISQKRVLSGSLGTLDTRQIIYDTEPEQILLIGKITANAIINQINRNYTLVYFKAPYKLYLSNDVYQGLYP